VMLLAADRIRFLAAAERRSSSSRSGPPCGGRATGLLWWLSTVIWLWRCWSARQGFAQYPAAAKHLLLAGFSGLLTLSIDFYRAAFRVANAVVLVSWWVSVIAAAIEHFRPVRALCRPWVASAQPAYRAVMCAVVWADPAGLTSSALKVASSLPLHPSRILTSMPRGPVQGMCLRSLADIPRAGATSAVICAAKTVIRGLSSRLPVGSSAKAAGAAALANARLKSDPFCSRSPRTAALAVVGTVADTTSSQQGPRTVWHRALRHAPISNCGKTIIFHAENCGQQVVELIDNPTIAPPHKDIAD